MDAGALSSGVKLPGREADHPHLVQRLRMTEALYLHHLYAFMACRGTPLPLHLLWLQLALLLTHFVTCCLYLTGQLMNVCLSVRPHGTTCLSLDGFL
jgi:hypothetical protein